MPDSKHNKMPKTNAAKLSLFELQYVVHGLPIHCNVLKLHPPKKRSMSQKNKGSFMMKNLLWVFFVVII